MYKNVFTVADLCLNDQAITACLNTLRGVYQNRVCGSFFLCLNDQAILLAYNTFKGVYQKCFKIISKLLKKIKKKYFKFLIFFFSKRTPRDFPENRNTTDCLIRFFPT